MTPARTYFIPMLLTEEKGLARAAMVGTCRVDYEEDIGVVYLWSFNMVE